MTTSPTRLRAVPPVAPSAAPAAPPTSGPEAAPVAPSQGTDPVPNRGSGRRSLLLIAAVVGLGGMSLIPLPHRINGPGEVIATEEAFEKISMPASGGTITAVQISTNQGVTPDTPLVQLQIDTLESQLSHAQQQQTQALAALESRRQQILQRRSELNEALAQQRSAQGEVARLQQDLQGGMPEVQGWQGEIAALQAEITGLQATLDSVTQHQQEVLPAVEAGAIARNHLRELQAQATQLENQIAQKQGQISAKQAQIAALYHQRRTTLVQAEAALGERQARQQTVNQGIQSALEEYGVQEQLALTQLGEVARLETRLGQYQTLHPTITGTVITPQQEIDALRGRYLEPGQPILEVMNPEQLTVDVWVRQEDRDLLAAGMAAEFRPQSARWESYPAVVETIAARTEFNEAEQKPMVRVTLRLESPDHTLQLRATGTARIATGTLPIYRKVSREFLKIVPLQKLWAF